MSESIEVCIDALAERGWHVHPGFLAGEAVAALREVCVARHRSGAFHAAGVGSGQAHVVSELRGDAIAWLEVDDPSPVVRAWLDAMESFRRAINAGLYLGLFELEAHFALYPPGAFYKRHLDRFRDDDRRTLTVILYLNEDWRPEHGGALRFYPDADAAGIDIEPRGGTLVTFLADRFWHEVLPARRPRMAVTGWFKRR